MQTSGCGLGWLETWPSGQDRWPRRRTAPPVGGVQGAEEGDGLKGIFVNRGKSWVLLTQFFSFKKDSNEKLLYTIFVQFFEFYNFRFRHFFIWPTVCELF